MNADEGPFIAVFPTLIWPRSPLVAEHPARPVLYGAAPVPPGTLLPERCN